MESQQASPKGSNCPICDRPLVPELDEGWRLTRGSSPRSWFPAHCKSDHKDYLAWKKSNGRLFTTIEAVGAGLAISLVYLTLYLAGWQPPPGRLVQRPEGALTVGFGLAVIAIIHIAISKWGIRKFRNEWKERGGPVASFDLNTTGQ